MNALFSPENKRTVDNWINDPKFQAMVEGDLGTPIKVKVLWDKNEVEFRGPIAGRVLKITDILEAYKMRMN